MLKHFFNTVDLLLDGLIYSSVGCGLVQAKEHSPHFWVTTKLLQWFLDLDRPFFWRGDFLLLAEWAWHLILTGIASVRTRILSSAFARRAGRHLKSTLEPCDVNVNFEKSFGPAQLEISSVV